MHTSGPDGDRRFWSRLRPAGRARADPPNRAPGSARRVRSIVAGLLLAALGAAGIPASAVLALRHTAEAQHEFQQGLRRQFITGLAASPVRVLAGPAEEGGVAAPVQFAVEEPAPPPDGAPIAVLRIPALGLEQVVVEGSSSRELSGAPGHRPDSARPGGEGVFAVAGRRLTHGAPFRDLSRLVPGNLIEVVTPEGTFVYEVTGSRVVGASEELPLSDSSVSRLALVTSAVSLTGDRRLVVTATLREQRERTLLALELPGQLLAAPDPGETATPVLSALGRLAATNIGPRPQAVQQPETQTVAEPADGPEPAAAAEPPAPAAAAEPPPASGPAQASGPQAPPGRGSGQGIGTGSRATPAPDPTPEPSPDPTPSEAETGSGCPAGTEPAQPIIAAAPICVP